MNARTPKLAEVITEDGLLNWIAETIQQKATKENAGFIQIEVCKRTSSAPPHLLVTTPAKFKHTITIATARLT